MELPEIFIADLICGEILSFDDPGLVSFIFIEGQARFKAWGRLVGSWGPGETDWAGPGEQL